MLDAEKITAPNSSGAPRIVATTLLVLFLCGLTVYLGNARIRSGDFRVDALQNLMLAYNLANYGQFSLSEPAPESRFKPTMYREPFPIAVTAAWLRLAFPNLAELRFVDQPNEGGQRVVTFEQANGENASKRVKRVNLIWSALIVFLSFLGARILTGSLIAATAAGVVIMLTSGLNAWLLSVLYTDLAASVPILATSLCLALLVRSGWFGWSIFAGLFLGLTILTKAIVLYVTPAIAITVVLLLRAKTGAWRPAFIQVAILLVMTSLIVGPWLARNVYLFDKPQIAGRDISVLQRRLLLDRMTPDEYRASFYAWAPKKVRPALERVFGYTQADIDPGGVGARLTRENKWNYHMQARDEMASLRERLREEGHRDYVALADDRIRDEIFAEITQRPLQHLLASIPLAWRGMWVRELPVWLAPPAFAALLAAFFWGAWSRRYDLVAFATTSVFTLGIYILTTHNLPRYSTPIAPVTLVCLVVLVYLLLTSLMAVIVRRRRGDVSSGLHGQAKASPAFRT